MVQGCTCAACGISFTHSSIRSVHETHIHERIRRTPYHLHSISTQTTRKHGRQMGQSVEGRNCVLFVMSQVKTM